MFVFGQGFDEELLRPKQPKQQGFFRGRPRSGTVVYPQIESLVAEMKVRGCSGLQDPTLQFAPLHETKR